MEAKNSTEKSGDQAESFWIWANAVYAHPGVADSLIEAQDRAGLNVNLLLWICWSATRFAEIPEIILRRATEATAQWSAQVTASLRAARRAAKSFEDKPGFENAASLRSDIKSAELYAERIEIEILEKLSIEYLTPTTDSDVKARARRSMTSYVAIIGAARRDGFSTGLLHTIIDHIFDQP